MTRAFAQRFPLGMLLTVLFAFGLRLYAIDRQDIWGDEAFSIWLSSQPLPQVVAGGADTHPPLYPVFLHIWLRAAGSNPFVTRFLSAAIGTLILPVVYVLGRRAFAPAKPGSKESQPASPLADGRGVGGVATLLTAISPVMIYYSQETRMYGLVTLMAAASVYWAMRLLLGARSKRIWLAYFAATLAAAYTHYYAFFVILAENLVLIAYWLRRHQRATAIRWLAVQGGLVLAYLPWIAVQTAFLKGKASARFDEWSLAAAWRIAGNTLSAFGTGLATPSTITWAVAVLFLITIGAGLIALLRQPRPGGWLVMAYLFLPLLLAWVVNPVMPFFYARYLLLLAPAFYLLAAWGTVAWQAAWRPLGAAVAVVLLVASLFSLQGYYTEDSYLKGRYGQMMTYVQANSQPGDGLILANQLQRPIFEFYQPQGIPAYFFPKYEYPLEDARTDQNLASLANHHGRLWLVRYGNPAEYDPDDYLSRWLATHGSKAYYDGWVDADLSLYVMSPAGPDSPTGASPVERPLRVDLGDQVRLVGFAMGAEEVAPGEPLLLTLYWQALKPIAERYTVFTHVLDDTEQIWAQMDSEPQGGGLPTDRWTVGQIVQDNYALTVGADAPRGRYSVEVGMYLLETLERLPVRNPDTGETLGDRIVLGTVEVQDP
jgi:mannosyltransferase